MPSLASLMEDYRNWRGRQDWEQGKGWQDFFGGDPRAQEQFEKLSGFGTDAGGLVGMIKASHGSPHMFDKFDFTKIGTGEGAQAYGHGGYFAQGFDSPVAKEYQDKLSTKVYVGGKRLDSIPSDGPLAQAHNSVVTAMSGQKIEPQEAINKAIKYWNNAADEMLSFVKDHPDLKDRIMQEVDSRRAIAKEAEQFSPDDFYRDPGHLYNVELKWPDAAREAADPLGEHHLLDWDAPLSEQKESIQNAIKKYWQENRIFGDPSKLTGEGIYGSIQAAALGNHGPGSFNRNAAADAASMDLKYLGIPGIRYLDQASRGAGTGSRNYVMFDDQFPEIVSRNGVSLSDLLRR